MFNWAVAEYEMEYRMKVWRDEAEHARLVRLAEAARPQGERLAALRRETAGLKDKAAWLSCQLQSRLSPGLDAAAC